MVCINPGVQSMALPSNIYAHNLILETIADSAAAASLQSNWPEIRWDDYVKSSMFVSDVKARHSIPLLGLSGVARVRTVAY